jgi:dihydroneopterin aldolase
MPRKDLHHPAPTSASSALRRVFVHDLEVMARVGIYEVERRYEQRIIVSVDLWVVDDYDGVSDRMRDIVDYEAIVRDVRNLVEADHVHLIETLAERIARNCLADPRSRSVRVRIEKPDILPGCHSVGIEIERVRGEPT